MGERRERKAVKAITFALAIAAATLSAQAQSTVAVFSPTMGVRYYPSMDIARTVAPIEARMACRQPGAIAGCEHISGVLHYGVLVVAASSDAQVRAFEVLVKYRKDGVENEHVDYLRNTASGGASKTIWLGQDSIGTVSVTPLRAAN